jgi:histidinol dehydrogenase
VAAKEAGVNEVYRMGGAQAVAAMAFGTDAVPRVDKIVGPGNIYVAMAKRAVYGYVDIDMIAGPSEILIIADSSADPAFIAADLLSQSEHDPMASSILITDNDGLAAKVADEVEKQSAEISRRDIIAQSLSDYGYIILVRDMMEAVRLANDIAPEHIELMVSQPFEMLSSIKNAGSIFLGRYSPEPLGDYMAGPNHVLPTGGTARFYSPLSVDDFIKKSSFIYYSEGALSAIKDDIIDLAQFEGLTAHANSVRVRFE